MIKYTLRDKSKIIFIVSEEDMKNTFLLKFVKNEIQGYGVDMSNVSWGVHSSLTLDDIRTCPISVGFLFAKTKAQNVGNIFCFNFRSLMLDLAEQARLKEVCEIIKSLPKS